MTYTCLLVKMNFKKYLYYEILLDNAIEGVNSSSFAFIYTKKRLLLFLLFISLEKIIFLSH